MTLALQKYRNLVALTAKYVSDIFSACDVFFIKVYEKSLMEVAQLIWKNF